MKSDRKTSLFLAFSLAHRITAGVDASHHHHLSLPPDFHCRARSFANDGNSSRRAPPPPSIAQRRAFLSVRGGASESASAWNAGSKYDYGRASPNLSSSKAPAQSYRTPPYGQGTRDEKGKEETKEAFAEAFLNRDNRNRFIARVYAILSGQLLVTAGAIHAFHLNPSVRDWMIYHPAGRKVVLFSLALSTISLLVSSSESIRQSLMKWPLLIAFTLGESVAVGFISSCYAYSSVIKAMTVTATTTLSVTLYTLLQKNPKYDLSQWGRALAGLGTAFLLYGLVRLLSLFGILPPGFLPYSEAIYCIFGAGLFSLYLAHHTRLIVAGKSAKYQMNEKDYIYGAMSLYGDIINIFIYILRILGEIDDRD